MLYNSVKYIEKGRDPMDKIYYQYIKEIIKEGSFSKASNNLYISQPSLSRSILTLEKKLGIHIFDRSKPHLELTLEGEKYLNYLEKSINLKNEFIEEVNILNNSKSREINIGVIPWKSPVFLPRIIPDFKIKYPNIKVNLTMDNSTNLENLLEKDELDAVVIIGPINNNSLEFREIYSSNIVIMTNKDSRINKEFNKSNDILSNKKLKMKELENENFVLVKNNVRYGRVTRNIFHQFNINPKNIFEVANLDYAINMVSIDMGLSFIPECYAKNNAVQYQNICFFPIDESKVELNLIVVYKKENKDYPTVKNFINFVYNNYNMG